MAYQSAARTFGCPHCGGTVRYEVGGRLDGGRIRWDASKECDGCAAVELHCQDTAVCVDDYAMLREQGGWFGLRVTVPGGDRVRLLKELREVLGLSLPEAARMLAVRAGPQLCGLEIEMCHVEARVRVVLPHAVTVVARVTDSSEDAQAVVSRLWMSG